MLEILEADTLEPPSGVTLQLEGSLSRSSKPSTSATFAFMPVRGPFHTLKGSLTFMPPAPSSGTRAVRPLCFRLSVSPDSRRRSPSIEPASASAAEIRALIGEPSQATTSTWDDKSYVFMSVTSGPMHVDFGRGEPGKAGAVSQEKGASHVLFLPRICRSGRCSRDVSTVQTAIRLIHLRPPPSPSPLTTAIALDPAPAPIPPRPITVIERPGLNNSTGQRLWDCAIGMSCFLSLHPYALDPSQALSTLGPAGRSSIAAPDRRRPVRKAPSPVRIVELGAGCALASQYAAHLLRSIGNTDAAVVATDVEATVDSTLRENLAANAGDLLTRLEDVPVHDEVLDWGKLAPGQGNALLAPQVTLLGTDILYNPSSHSLLLETLLYVLRPALPSPPSDASSSFDDANLARRALIAYKRRTDGDDGFFELARRAGLGVRRVWEWGEVSVWAFE